VFLKQVLCSYCFKACNICFRCTVPFYKRKFRICNNAAVQLPFRGLRCVSITPTSYKTDFPDLKFCKWKSKKSGARSNFNLKNTRFLSGSSQGYRKPTSTGQRSKENSSQKCWFTQNFLKNMSTLTSEHKGNQLHVPHFTVFFKITSCALTNSLRSVSHNWISNRFSPSAQLFIKGGSPNKFSNSCD
jgi:hypothetical protein